MAALAAGEIREDLGVGGAGHQGLEHGPPGGAEQTRGDRSERDPGVFEHLVEAVGVAGALLDKEFPVAGKITELADRRGRDEAGPNEAALEELGDPGGVVVANSVFGRHRTESLSPDPSLLDFAALRCISRRGVPR